MRLVLTIALLTMLTIQPAEAWRGRVIGISDGDTITVLHDRVPVKVRLAGIDCPEKDQDYGDKARQATSKMVYGRVVNVIELKKDRYGRTVASVRFGLGRDLSRELLKKGFAWWYESVAPKDSALSKLQDKAREKKLGLWNDPKPTPPWEYRKNKAD